MNTTEHTPDWPVEILIVEDSPTQAQQLQHILEQHRYQVTVAANGQQALEAMQRRKPTLIISDVVMPEMDGYQLCQQIKAAEPFADLPVILLTSLSSAHDVILGLQCGADNFIRKPYDAAYLLSRINYLLSNRRLRLNQKLEMGIELYLGGRKHFINSDRRQILDLLISTYEQAVHLNEELKQQQGALDRSYRALTGLYRMAENLNRCKTENEVIQSALERALQLPGVQAGWGSLLNDDGTFRVLASGDLPPALREPEALQGECACRRRLLQGELRQAANILECERLQKAAGDTGGLRYHASVPLRVGERVLGLLNLAGENQGLFSDEGLQLLHSVGNQVGIALERADLYERMEQKIRERTAQLEAEVAERQRAENEVRQLNAELEQRVRERTAELEAANKELEAFSYSVSHDLRAPLRAIDGFAGLLRQQHGPHLPPGAQRHIQVISDETRRMGELIDDLLRFARLSRQPLRRRAFSAADLVQQALEELRREREGRQIDLVCADLPECEGDPALLKQVWINLLSNALKYTRPRATARIEIACEQREGEQVFSVRDNGVGFDMRYANKLFGVFQRLHRAEEFDGTGVGLAIVQRVIHRHGGRVWAEAKPDEGAAFYFTLPRPPQAAAAGESPSEARP